MLKMYVNEMELEPVVLGARKDIVQNEEVLILTFKSKLPMEDIVNIFKSLPDGTTVTVENERDKHVFVDFCSMFDEIGIKLNDNGTYSYTVYLKKKSALDIAQQAAADVEYLAAVTGVEL